MAVRVQELEKSMAVRALPTPATPPDAQVWTITPEIAGDWLARAGTNRHQYSRAVANYAAAMERGEWQLTGETIKFDTNGKLIDGQHRLSAVVQSGVTIQSLVIHGVDPSAFDVLDSGRLRSPSDVLAIHGYANTMLLAATAKLVILYQASGTFAKHGKEYLPSKPEILRFVQDNPRIVDVVRIISGGRIRFQSTPPALLAALYYLFEQIDDEDCEAFFDKLKSGANLTETDPIYHLRQRLIDNASTLTKIPHPLIGALIIKAWNAWRAGQEMRALSYRPGGSRPEPHPVIQ